MIERPGDPGNASPALPLRRGLGSVEIICKGFK